MNQAAQRPARAPVLAAPMALFLPCAGGTEGLLADEIRALLARQAEAPAAAASLVQAVVARRGGVAIEPEAADIRSMLVLAMLFNLESRLAQRVLLRLAAGPYRGEDDLYALAARQAWADWVTPEQALKVDVTSVRSPLRSLNFAALRVKDAVCDVLRRETGARPDVDTRRPDLPIVLHLEEDWATLYVDTSGEALFKRGWREDKGEAPLKETLAAAMLAAAGWAGRPEDGPLFDPCCGSGTLLIEAAQIACDIAPGSQRRFAFERWPVWQPLKQDWMALKAAAKMRIRPCPVALHGGDVSFRLTDYARRNAERAGVLAAIEFKTADALQQQPPEPAGTMVLNPPYGERISPKGSKAARDEAPADFYQRLAAHWKRNYAGWTTWILSPDPKLPSAMRLKETRRVPMWNGPIECRLFRFDIVDGSMRR